MHKGILASPIHILDISQRPGGSQDSTPRTAQIAINFMSNLDLGALGTLSNDSINVSAILANAVNMAVIFEAETEVQKWHKHCTIWHKQTLHTASCTAL